jgi:hypothetical protein
VLTARVNHCEQFSDDFLHAFSCRLGLHLRV